MQYADLIRDRDKFCQFFVTVVLKNNVSAIKTAPSLQKEADFCNGRCEMIHVYLFSAPFTENHSDCYENVKKVGAGWEKSYIFVRFCVIVQCCLILTTEF